MAISVCTTDVDTSKTAKVKLAAVVVVLPFVSIMIKIALCTRQITHIIVNERNLNSQSMLTSLKYCPVNRLKSSVIPLV